MQPIDARLSARRAVVLRRRREDLIVADLERERSALESESADLERRRARAAREERVALEVEIEVVEQAIRAVRNRARAALADITAEHDAKMRVLRAKLDSARGPARVRLDARISERVVELRQRAKALTGAAT